MAAPIKICLDRIPGGIIAVPLFVGILIDTFFPTVLQIGGVTTEIFNILLDKIARGSGIAGAAVSSVGGNAVATPFTLADMDVSLSATASIATSQIAASVAVTTISRPVLTTLIYKRRKRSPKEPSLDDSLA